MIFCAAYSAASVRVSAWSAPLYVALVTAAGSRPTRRAAAVAALSTEVLRRRSASTGSHPES